jgi:hypothetical protein
VLKVKMKVEEVEEVVEVVVLAKGQCTEGAV